jgi:hypothetical protein
VLNLEDNCCSDLMYVCKSVILQTLLEYSLSFPSFSIDVSRSQFNIGLSALLVPQVLQKSNFSPLTIFSLKLVPKHLIRSIYRPWHRFLTNFFTFLCHAGKVLVGFYQKIGSSEHRDLLSSINIALSIS